MGRGNTGSHKHSEGRPESWKMGEGEAETIAGSCHKDVTPPHPHGKPSLTPEEKGREMAKYLLGLKLSNCIK